MRAGTSANKLRCCQELHESLAAWRDALKTYRSAVDRFIADGVVVDQAAHQAAVEQAHQAYQGTQERWSRPTAVGPLYRPEYDLLVKISKQLGEDGIDWLLISEDSGESPRIERRQLRRFVVEDDPGEKLTQRMLVQLVALSGLEDVMCAGAQQITSLEPLVRLPRLTRLAVTDSKISSLGPVQQMSQLQALDLFGAPVRDLARLVGHQTLAILDLGGTNVRDFSALTELPQLIELRLDRLEDPNVDWASLAELSGLRVLSLLGNILGNLGMLPTGLRELDLSDAVVESLAGLDRAVQLEHLDLVGARFPDLKNLPVLPNLRELVISFTTVDDVRPLKRFPSLESLWINNTKVDDLEPLLELPNLRHVEVTGGEYFDPDYLDDLNQRYAARHGRPGPFDEAW